MSTQPITDKIKRLRQRQRRDGGWRIWWEPETAVRDLGFETVELDADRPTWSKRQANALNADVDKARAAGGRIAAQTGGRTMAALVHEYRQSRHFKDLKPATRIGYNTNLNTIDAKWGSDPVKDFSKPVVATWYEALLNEHGVSWSKSLILTMSRLFWFAERLGWRPEGSNPARSMGLKAAAPRERWATWAEFDAMTAAADALDLPQMAVAMGLSALNGARQTDVRQARRDAFTLRTVRDWSGKPHQRLCWDFTRSKRGNSGVLPIHALLQPRIDALLAAGPTTSEFLLVEPTTGGQLTQKRFNQLWMKIRKHAAKTCPSVSTLQFRDLRRTFGVWARAGQADKPDIGDVLGNSAAVDPLLGETYMPATFFTAGRAIDSIKRPEGEDE